MERSSPPTSVTQLAWVFLRLGLTSFGGPVAHLGYFHDEIVRRRQWMDEAEFADLVALCQFLPGPASSQVVFAIGQRRGGLIGAMVASLTFLLPSALIMIAFAYGVTELGDLRTAGWLHGLKLAAVAVVAQAVWTMGRKLCPDVSRVILALTVAAAVSLLSGVTVQIGAIAIGALLGWLLYRREFLNENPRAKKSWSRRHGWAAAMLLLFASLLMVLPMLVSATGNKTLSVIDGFYRSGALVFGGGHVVLPLLRAELVPPGWISDELFLAGYGAAQAVPGPLFTFAAYLGTVIFSGPQAWLGGLVCLLAIFLPAWLLIGGALPFWHSLRSKAWSQAGLRGANAAVVGILLAALYNPIWVGTVVNRVDLAIVLVAWSLLQIWRRPSWLVVVLCAAAGQWLG